MRLQALHTLDEGRQGVFADLALADPEPRVRAAAAAKVSEPSRLERLAAEGDEGVRRIARERLSGKAAAQARSAQGAGAVKAVERIAERKALAELALRAADAQARAAALDKLLALADPGEAQLELVAVQDADGAAGLRCLPRIDRRGTLKDIARKAKAPAVRQAAEARIAALAVEAGKPSAETLRLARLGALRELMEPCARLAVTEDWLRAEDEWERFEASWKEAMAKGGELPTDAEAAPLLARKLRAREDYLVRRKVWEEQQSAARQARVAWLDRLAGLQPPQQRAALVAEWRGLPALAQGADLEQRLEAELARLCPAEAQAPAPIEAAAAMPAPAAAEAGPAGAEEVVAEAERLAAEPGDPRQTRFRFQDLHKRWSMLTDHLPREHALRLRFANAYAAFKDGRVKAREQRAAGDAERMTRLRALIGEAEALVAAAEALGPAPAPEAVQAHLDRCQKVQADWRAVGPMPARLLGDLPARFRTAVDAAYAPVRAAREAADWERFANLAKAEELSVQVEALAAAEDWPLVARSVKQAQAAWKRIGPLPREKAQAAWDRFHAACEAQFVRCKPWFEQQDAQRKASLERRLALIAEAETIAAAAPVGLPGSPADLAARKAASERMKTMQVEWKESGPAPREEEDGLWTRWRAAQDAFWGKQREQLAARDADQERNLAEKLALCQEAEALAQHAENAANRPEPAELFRRVREVQQRWKTIGHVPRNRQEEVWQRHKAACDRVFAVVRPWLDAQEEQRKANLAAKQAVCAEFEELLGRENARWFEDEVRELHQRFRAAGHVPRADMDAINGRWDALEKRWFEVRAQG